MFFSGGTLSDKPGSNKDH